MPKYLNTQIQFKKPFSTKYTLLIETDMMAVNMVIKSKAKMRWEFKVLRSTRDYTEVELTLLDNVLLESNNEMIKDLSKMSQAFSKMYSELHLILDNEGKILEILNLDLILEKWSLSKKEMEVAIEHSPEAKEVILLNDSIFKDKEKVKTAIEANEFFSIYFAYVYGRKFPYKIKDEVHNNFLNTASLQWKSNVTSNVQLPSDEKKIIIDVHAKPYGHLSSSWHQKAYGSFKDVMNISKLSTTLNKQANYTVDNLTGKIIKATLKNTEIADKSKLFNIMTYTLTCDHDKNKQPAATEKDSYKQKNNSPNRRSFLID